MGRLDNKVAIISGAAGGIGYATAEKFLEEGASVMICDMDAARLAAAAETLSQKGKVLWEALSITDVEAVEAMVKRTKEELGSVDILINNAGITKDAQFYKMDLAQFQQVIDVNLMGTVIMSKAVVPYMMAQKSGRIVHSSSDSAVVGNFGQTNYGASKGGVIGFTKCLAREVARNRVTVNCIAPSYINTEMLQAVPEATMQRFLAAIPMERLGEPEELAAAAAFLCSDDSSFVTGECLVVSGGSYM